MKEPAHHSDHSCFIAATAGMSMQDALQKLIRGTLGAGFLSAGAALNANRRSFLKSLDQSFHTSIRNTTMHSPEKSSNMSSDVLTQAGHHAEHEVRPHLQTQNVVELNANLLVVYRTLKQTLLPAMEALQDAIFEVNAAKGFWDTDRNMGEALCLIHSEVSEGLEAHRKGLISDHIPEFSGLEEELADAIIRILDLSGGKQLRTLEALFEKLEFNLTRPHKHGKQF